MAGPEDVSSIHQLGRETYHQHKIKVKQIKLEFNRTKRVHDGSPSGFRQKPHYGVLMGGQWQAHHHPGPQHDKLHPYLSNNTYIYNALGKVQMRVEEL